MKSVGKRLRVGATAVLAAGLVLIGCASKPNDDAQLTQMNFDNLMGSRYTEILLVFGNAITKNFIGRGLQHTRLERRQPCGRRRQLPRCHPRQDRHEEGEGRQRFARAP